MMILTDEEMTELVTANLEAGGGYHQLGNSVQAAIMAKLASAELPEPIVWTDEGYEGWHASKFIEEDTIETYTADQLRQAYAQGAAAQLSDEPRLYAYTVNKVHNEYCEFAPPADAYDEGTLTPLYTRRQAND